MVADGVIAQAQIIPGIETDIENNTSTSSTSGIGLVNSPEADETSTPDDIPHVHCLIDMHETEGTKALECNIAEMPMAETSPPVSTSAQKDAEITSVRPCPAEIALQTIENCAGSKSVMKYKTMLASGKECNDPMYMTWKRFRLLTVSSFQQYVIYEN